MLVFLFPFHVSIFIFFIFCLQYLISNLKDEDFFLGWKRDSLTILSLQGAFRTVGEGEGGKSASSWLFVDAETSAGWIVLSDFSSAVPLGSLASLLFSPALGLPCCLLPQC